MQHKALKYILDIESVISEIETIKKTTENNFELFKKDRLYVRAIERLLEITGEAVRKLIETDPNIELPNSSKIIGLRNIISHAYDSVDDELLWSIIQKNVPELKANLQKIKESYT